MFSDLTQTYYVFLALTYKKHPTELNHAVHYVANFFSAQLANHAVRYVANSGNRWLNFGYQCLFSSLQYVFLIYNLYFSLLLDSSFFLLYFI